MSDLISRQTTADYMARLFPERGIWEIDGDEVKEAEKEKMIEVMDMLSHVPSAQEWIPVKFRPMTKEERKYFEEEYVDGYELEDNEAVMFDCQMPNDKQKILVTYRHCLVEIDVCEYDGEFYGLEENGDWDGITAWQPLPEPYKGGED